MGKILSKGHYEIDMDTYHGDCCDGFSVSGSGLVKLENTSPAHFWWHSYLNPQRPEVDTTALKFGRAAHAIILGEPEFAKYFIVSPYDDFKTKEARQWREQQMRTVVRPQQMDMIRAMAKSILQTPLIKNAFIDGKPEQSLIWKDAETGIWLKSRPDWLPNSIPFVPNYKTTKSARPDDWRKDAFKLGYHQGAALCLEGIKQVLGWASPSYYFVVQEKEAPYVALPITMRDTDIEWGALLNRRNLRRLSDCLMAGKWPAYAEGAVEVSMPEWSEKLLLDRHAAGEFETKQEIAA